MIIRPKNWPDTIVPKNSLVTPWTQSPHDLCDMLGTDPHAGLTPAEAQRRLEEQGPNQLTEAKGKSPWRLFFEQFQSVVIWVLMAAAVLSGIMRELIDTMAILAIIVINAILGFVQESRAERSLAALRRMSSPVCKVLRGGHMVSLDTHDLVVGDVIIVEAGDRIPADARILSRHPTSHPKKRP